VSPTWFRDEAGLAGPEHLEPAYVAAYDRKAAFDPSEDVTLLRELGLDDRRTLVDLGAGTGTLALAAAPYCARVVAVDISPAMVAETRQRADALGLGNVECVEAGFLSYEHEGAPADAVYSRNALHHLPDVWKAIALDRIASMLRAGGILRVHDLVFAFDPAEAGESIEAWLASAVESADAGWTRQELETHLREEHSTFTWLLEPMLERAGFTIESSDYRRGIYAEYVCRKR
jgi:SAM-dependent methyltransferase